MVVVLWLTGLVNLYYGNYWIAAACLVAALAVILVGVEEEGDYGDPSIH